MFTVARKEWHWVSHNPFDGVGKLHEGRGRVRFLSEEERSARMRETVKDPVLHTFVVLALFSYLERRTPSIVPRFRSNVPNGTCLADSPASS